MWINRVAVGFIWVPKRKRSGADLKVVSAHGFVGVNARCSGRKKVFYGLACLVIFWPYGFMARVVRAHHLEK
jgi:hypothetical protein